MLARAVLTVAVIGVALAVAGSVSAGQKAPALPGLVSCGGTPFEPAALDNPTGAERAPGRAAKLLREAIRHYGGYEIPKRGWRVLSERDREVQYGSGTARDLAIVVVERTPRRGWDWTGLGSGCEPRVLRGSLLADSWRLSRRHDEPTAASSELHVAISDDACASGRAPGDRILEPTITYGPNAIRIMYFIRPPRGIQTCPGSPPGRRTLRLDEPLGDRVLLDAGTLVPKQRFPRD